MSILGTLANFGNAVLPGHPFVGEAKNNGNFVNNGYPGITPQQAVQQVQAPAGQPQEQASGGGYSSYAGGGAANSALASNFATQKNNIFGTANDAAANAGVGLNNSILGLVDSLRSGQNSVDNQAIQNELAKRQGVAGVQAQIGRGIQSGGVTLANKNASNSSAAGALARAYGDIGRQQLSGVNNEYAQGQNAVNQAQSDLDIQRAAGVRGIQDSKQQVVNNITADARNQLAALDSAIAGASLPDRINIDQAKEQVRSQALAALQQYDQQLQSSVGGVQASSQESRQAEAARLATAGVAPESAFNYGSDIPTEFQNSGPFASNLPIFTFNRARKSA